MEFERREIHFSGRVQGVGFRYTTHRIASNLDVTGYVKNLPDGRVLLVAEGPRVEIDSLLSQLGQQMESNISETEIRQDDWRNEFDSFRITR